MRRVLVLAYHFPPVSGAGAQRPTKLARYLPDAGYECVVLTGPSASGTRWTPEDASLAGELLAHAEVCRIPTPEPPPEGAWRRRAKRWLGRRSAWSQWWIQNAVAAGSELARDADLVYAKMQPYVSADAAQEIARQAGIPWVADLGDPWALDEMWLYPTGLHRRRAIRQMGAALDSASAVIMSTAVAADRVKRRFPRFSGTPVVTVPNGFDPSNFASHQPQRRDDSFRIVHTGYLHTELGLQHRRTAWVRELLRGSVRGLDILARSHVFLIDAAKRVVAAEPGLASKLEVHLAGVVNETDRAVVEDLPFVKIHGYLSHAESVELVRTADLLFLPMHDLPAGMRAGLVPGKTYEYLASGKPILAAVPDGDARDILTAAGNASLCRPRDVACLAEAIAAHLRRVRNNEQVPPPRPDVLERFDYRNLAREVATVFDGVLEKAAPTPSAGTTAGPAGEGPQRAPVPSATGDEPSASGRRT